MTNAVEVAAPMTGVVYKLSVAAGATVAEGDDVVVLESMKMHIPVAAPKSGQVQEVRVKEGDFVQEGDVLFVLG